MNKIEEKYMRYAFSKLYIKACKEQMTKDDRIVSPRMRDIDELKKWYFGNER